MLSKQYSQGKGLFYSQFTAKNRYCFGSCDVGTFLGWELPGGLRVDAGGVGEGPQQDITPYSPTSKTHFRVARSYLPASGGGAFLGLVDVWYYLQGPFASQSVEEAYRGSGTESFAWDSHIVRV